MAKANYGVPCDISAFKTAHYNPSLASFSLSHTRSIPLVRVVRRKGMESDICHFCYFPVVSGCVFLCFVCFYLLLFYTVCTIIGATVMFRHYRESVNRPAFRLSPAIASLSRP